MKTFALLLLAAAGAFADAPTVAAVQNAADFTARIAPGVVAAVYGTNFGSGAPSTVTVNIGGKAAFVASVTPNQLTIQIPFEAATGSSSITVTVAGATSAAFPITLDTYAPALFAFDGTGAGPGLVTTPGGAKITTTAPANPGDTLVAYAVGLGQTNPPTATGPATASNPTATQPTLTIGGQQATIIFAGVVQGQPGLYQINFKVPAGVQGTQPMVLSIGGKSSNPTAPITLALFGISAVVSNASFGSSGTGSAGSIVSLFGNGFGTTDQSVGFPSTTFQGVSVIVNGIPAPLFHLIATQGQIDFLLPFELPASGTVNVQLKTPTATTLNYTLTMAAATPGIYFVPDPGTKGRTNVVAQFNGTAWLAIPASMATALKIPGNCTANGYDVRSLCGQPAKPGDILALYTTGLGKATPNGDPAGKPLVTGQVPPADGSILYKTVATPTVTVGGLPATVLFSGMAPGFAGLYQIDFRVPDGVTGDDVPVAISISGSPVDTRTVSIQVK